MTLLNGDCLKEMENIESGSVDLILADPPYGTIKCKWDTVIPFGPMWRQLKRIIKPTGAIVLMAGEPFTSRLICSNINEFKYRWVWEKNKSTGFLNAKKQPLRCIEDICVFYKKQCTYNPQKTFGHKPVNSFKKNTSDGDTMGKTKIGISGGGQTDRYPKNIIKNIRVMNNDGSHGKKTNATQKPVKLMEYLIRTYSNENDKVLDFAMGSATTAIACLNTKRSFIGIELDPQGFKDGSERVEEYIKTIASTTKVSYSLK